MEPSIKLSYIVTIMRCDHYEMYPSASGMYNPTTDTSLFTFEIIKTVILYVYYILQKFIYSQIYVNVFFTIV